MDKQFFKRYLPKASTMKKHPNLQFFGTLLHDGNLWHLNRRSLSGGMAVGLFMAFIPVPMQMIFAAALAILLRVNLPLSVALVWITNPVTIPPLFYAAYKLGAFILGTAVKNIEFTMTFEWLTTTLLAIWRPFLLGCFLMGSLSALIGYLTVRLLWRLQVKRVWQERVAARRLKKEQKLLKKRQRAASQQIV